MTDRTDRTTKTRERFLELLAETGNVRHACDILKLQRSTLYEWRARDRSFAAAWNAALMLGADGLEDEARRRALAGSDVLLIFLLKGLKPDRYRERSTIDINRTTQHDCRGMPMHELRARLDRLRAEQDAAAHVTPVASAEGR